MKLFGLWIVAGIFTDLSTAKTFIGSAAVTSSFFVSQTTVVADPMGATLLERVAREGGFFAIVLILLYFYRRDTKWATEFWKERAEENAKMIAENARSQSELAAALRENNVIVHQAKNIIAEYYPGRRSSDSVVRMDKP